MPEGRPGQLLLAGLLVGAGGCAAADEIVFHQLLHWHHFYDRSTPAVGVVSDGLLHTAELVAVVAGLVLLADLRRRGAFQAQWWWGSLLVGLGGFQLYDGLIDHKLLRVHQIRYGVPLLPYDLSWTVPAVVALLLGGLLLLRSRRQPARQERPADG
jgi:uncharacterized membrane protein